MTQRRFNKLEAIPRRTLLIGLGATVVVGAGVSANSWRKQPAEARRCRAETPFLDKAKPAPCVEVKRPLLVDIPFLQSTITNLVRLPLMLPQTARDNALALVLGGSATGLAARFDRPIRDWVQTKLKPVFGSGWSVFYGKFGARYGALALGGLYLLGEIFGRRKLAATCLLSGQAVLLSNIVLEICKDLVRRKRPVDSPSDAFAFDWPPKNTRRGRVFFGSNSSFASSHPASIAATGAVFASTFLPGATGKALVVAASGAMALARVNDDKHWLSDTLVGSLVGLYVGGVVSRFSPFVGRLT